MIEKEKKEYFAKLVEYGDRLETDVSLVNSILDEHFASIPKQKLYKFRKCNNDNFRALEQNSIWMSKASSFLDTFDSIINIDPKKNSKEIEKWLRGNLLRYIFEYTKNICVSKGIDFPYTFSDYQEHAEKCYDKNGNLKKDKEIEFLKDHASAEERLHFDEIVKRIYSFREQMESRLEPLAEELSKAINQSRNYSRENMLIYCMTERFDNPSLWENYAENYTGFCIEYSFANYQIAPFDIYKNLVYLMPMTYRARRPVFNLVPFMDGAIRKSVLHEEIEDSPEQKVELNMQLYYKNKDYEYEHEWRFAIKNQSNNLQSFPFVSAIYVGKSIKPKNLSRIKKIANQINVLIYQQKEKNSSYTYGSISEVKQ